MILFVKDKGPYVGQCAALALIDVNLIRGTEIAWRGPRLFILTFLNNAHFR